MPTHSRAQIVATLGPASAKAETIEAMIAHQMDVARLNFSWGDASLHDDEIAFVRAAETKAGRHIPILMDLPGPRIQGKEGHTYDKSAIAALTDKDREFIRYGVAHNVDYIGISFVGGPADVEEGRKAVADAGGTVRIVAKIERARALESLDAIIAAADAVMVARGDLGTEVPLEQIPFVEARIIAAAKKAGKPVITATQMMLSMTDNPAPTRAEVTDVANAILLGSDAVMLSEETARGSYPVEAVAMMEKIVLEAERHMGAAARFNVL